MDRLWTPWRYTYVSKAAPSVTCIFCDKANPGDDKANLVIYRARHSFVLLNLFPYNNGHIMVAPYEHVATLEELSEEAAIEMFRLTRRAEGILRRVYRPKGINLGMNIGECAGAGVADHIHMHVLPRWPGDVSFMTSIGETRVIPEDLTGTWEKLSVEFQNLTLDTD
jgi:ATP adenylyltransferase